MDDLPFEVNLIEELTSEHSEEIKLEANVGPKAHHSSFDDDQLM